MSPANNALVQSVDMAIYRYLDGTNSDRAIIPVKAAASLAISLSGTSDRPFNEVLQLVCERCISRHLVLHFA